MCSIELSLDIIVTFHGVSQLLQGVVCSDDLGLLDATSELCRYVAHTYTWYHDLTEIECLLIWISASCGVQGEDWLTPVALLTDLLQNLQNGKTIIIIMMQSTVQCSKCTRLHARLQRLLTLSLT